MAGEEHQGGRKMAFIREVDLEKKARNPEELCPEKERYIRSWLDSQVEKSPEKTAILFKEAPPPSPVIVTRRKRLLRRRAAWKKSSPTILDFSETSKQNFSTNDNLPIPKTPSSPVIRKVRRRILDDSHLIDNNVELMDTIPVDSQNDASQKVKRKKFFDDSPSKENKKVDVTLMDTVPVDFLDDVFQEDEQQIKSIETEEKSLTKLNETNEVALMDTILMSFKTEDPIIEDGQRIITGFTQSQIIEPFESEDEGYTEFRETKKSPNQAIEETFNEVIENSQIEVIENSQIEEIEKSQNQVLELTESGLIEDPEILENDIPVPIDSDLTFYSQAERLIQDPVSDDDETQFPKSSAKISQVTSGSVQNSYNSREEMTVSETTSNFLANKTNFWTPGAAKKRKKPKKGSLCEKLQSLVNQEISTVRLWRHQIRQHRFPWSSKEMKFAHLRILDVYTLYERQFFKCSILQDPHQMLEFFTSREHSENVITIITDPEISGDVRNSKNLCMNLFLPWKIISDNVIIATKFTIEAVENSKIEDKSTREVVVENFDCLCLRVGKIVRDCDKKESKFRIARKIFELD